jgi:hypothetical protein
MAAFQTYKSNTSGDNLRMTLHASMIDCIFGFSIFIDQLAPLICLLWVLNTTFNNSSVIFYRSFLLVDENNANRENH